ncbi:acetyl-CoA carboxylase biotin carboxylase subunit [Acidithrix ferrooxidans]|uniref:biotin carboxylase n=1 Tax=Acidithrix ferrooxidans TaxID=1280514 RepID=A0A0D8HKX6_9ACTN|nr:acetyl-CoA carboxylase biotin carboxylase subunit [Acidithrix ferrooxidans]KJF18660.1 biotin carboxylase [Acidithrix ferrooxidans]
MISKVLVANRGEIAVRIIRACFDEGLISVAALSEADLDSMPARLADEVICIGEPSANASYLSVGTQISAAILAKCDAIHPGYGFLSEQPALAEEANRWGITFVGPSADAIRRGGDKVAARELARSLGVAVASGSDAVSSVDEAENIAKELGYPLLLKAAGGGGGKGMRQIHNLDELRAGFEQASNEARAAFGDDRIYIERYVENARHIEVQIMADRFGKVVHLGDRDCSCQRRFQKLVEEAPATIISETVRRELAEAAISLLSALDYVGAGTVEFLYDLDRESYFFLEVNTRVQVEHPVTEMVTEIDIVREQLRVAGGAPLSFSQSDVKISGHAIECRVNAESALNGFTASPGLITSWTAPMGSGVRVDTHCYSGYRVSPYYDSMLGKLICHGNTRSEAITKLLRSLTHFEIEGVATTIDLHRSIISSREFGENQFTTVWLERAFLPRFLAANSGSNFDPLGK